MLFILGKNCELANINICFFFVVVVYWLYFRFSHMLLLLFVDIFDFFFGVIKKWKILFIQAQITLAENQWLGAMAVWPAKEVPKCTLHFQICLCWFDKFSLPTPLQIASKYRHCNFLVFGFIIYNSFNFECKFVQTVSILLLLVIAKLICWKLIQTNKFNCSFFNTFYNFNFLLTFILV